MTFICKYIIVITETKMPKNIKYIQHILKSKKSAYFRSAASKVMLRIKFGSSLNSAVDALISLMVIMPANQTVGHKT